MGLGGQCVCDADCGGTSGCICNRTSACDRDEQWNSECRCDPNCTWTRTGNDAECACDGTPDECDWDPEAETFLEV